MVNIRESNDHEFKRKTVEYMETTVYSLHNPNYDAVHRTVSKHKVTLTRKNTSI